MATQELNQSILDMEHPPPIPTRSTTTEISRVAIKAPPFWKPNVQLWFMQMESQFVTAGITSEDTKFHYVMGAIESDVLNQVSDFLVNIPSHNKYTLLKTKLIKEFSESEERKTRKLLTELELGDKKPSCLLREMRQLAGQEISDQFLRNMFLQNLPIHVRAILTCSSDSLEALALMADKILDTAPTERQVYSVESNAKDDKIRGLENQIAQLSKQINELITGRNRGRSPTPENRSRGRSRSRSAGRFPNCWYHYKFGSKAEKCIKPCNFDKPKAQTSSEN